MEPWTTDELRDVLAKIAADPQLTQAAIEDPAEAIARASGREVPTGITLKVLEKGNALSVATDVADAAIAFRPSLRANCCQIPDALEICCAKAMRYED